MARMLPNNAQSSQMLPYPSTVANTVHIAYDQAGVQYNQPQFTYEYTTFRGNAELRVRRGVVMESNNGSL